MHRHLVQDLVFKCRAHKNVKPTCNCLPNIGPISAVREPTPYDWTHASLEAAFLE